MNKGVVRRVFRMLGVAGVWFGVVGATPAFAQVEIYPWQNIQQVVNGYPAGTTFYLKAGVHRMQTIVPRSWDRFVGEAGTVLSGARQLTSFGRSGSYWYAAGQSQQGRVDYAECKPGFPRCAYPEDLYFDGVPLRHVNSLSAVGPGTFFFDYGADRIYFWDDPTNRYVEASVTPKAFDGWATDVLVSGLVIEKYATPVGDGTVPAGTRWTVQWSDIKLNHGTAVGTGHETKVLYNLIHHNGHFGITGAGNFALIEGNEISYNNYAGFETYWGAGGTKFVFTWGLTVRGNYAHHNFGAGLWTDIGNIYTLYENNTVEDNDRAGIFHELSYDATIRNNTARRNALNTKPYPYWTTGAGIEVLDSRNVEVYGNVVEDNWQGITGLDSHRGSGAYGPYVLQNFNVHNNWITSRITDAGGGRSGIIDMDGWTAYVYGNNRFWGNQYVLANPDARYFMWFGERNRWEWQNYGNDVGSGFSFGSGGGTTRYLSDMNWSWMVNGWGPAERDRSNGDYWNGDGRAISLDGVVYGKGLGVHSDSDVRYLLNGQCTTFSAIVGVDDETSNWGAVIFQVWVDGVIRYNGPVTTGWDPARAIQIDVSGGNELRLVVHNGWDGYYYDHADWADAKVTCR